MKFRKKPVEVDAFLWTGDERQTEDPLWIIDAIKEGEVYFTKDPAVRMHMKTLEGVMTAQQGDWIIRGVKGEIYACKPDIFEMTYERV